MLRRLQPKILLMKELLAGCRSRPHVVDVRQCGFIGAVEIGPYPIEAQMGLKVCRALRSRGVLTRPVGNVIVILPPYCTDGAQLLQIFTALMQSIGEVCGG